MLTISLTYIFGLNIVFLNAKIQFVFVIEYNTIQNDLFWWPNYILVEILRNDNRFTSSRDITMIMK